jgi:hypothetical protein
MGCFFTVVIGGHARMRPTDKAANGDWAYLQVKKY